MTIRGVRLVGIVVFGTLVLGACGDDEQAPAATDPPAAPTTVPTTGAPTTLPPTTLPPTTPPIVPIVSTEAGVAFYPACGNETLDHDGVTWYPVTDLEFHDANDEFLDRMIERIEQPRDPSPVVGIDGFARVVAPGPGDDVGTLVVWADGVARWVSESGTLDVWLVDDELTYNWVC